MLALELMSFGPARTAYQMLKASLLLCLMVLAIPAYALSCAPLAEHLFIDCKAGTCTGAFRAREIHAFGPCGQRLIVDSVPEGYLDVLKRHIEHLPSGGTIDGPTEVVLLHRFYGTLPESAEDLSHALGDHELRAPRIQVLNLDSLTNFRDLRNNWSAKASEHLLRFAMYMVIEAILLALAVFLTYRTTVSYRKRLVGHFSGEEHRLSLAGPVLIQAALCLAGIFSLASPTEPVLVGLIAPCIVFAVWPLELGTYVCYRFKTHRTIAK